MKIISAFYGLLRSLDAIHPYRLEVQSKLKINGKNLDVFQAQLTNKTQIQKYIDKTIQGKQRHVR